MRKTVSKEFRDKVAAKYPGLAKNPAYWALLRELIFRQSTYGSKGLILLGYHKLAEWNGKDASSHSGKRFLEAFKRDVLPDFEYSDYVPNRECRTVKEFGVDDEVMEWAKEMPDKREVFFETGLKVHGKSIKEGYVEAKKAIARHQKLLHCDAARTIFEYHNAKKTNKFKMKINENIEAAKVYLEELREELRDVDENVYLVQRETLNDILYYPMPLLEPKYKADRLFSHSPSLTTIKSEIRKVLTRGWVETDLKNAQLSIIAKLWDIPSLQDFLSKGESIWTYLYSELGIGQEYKPALKVCVYSMAYGAGEETVEKSFRSGCGDGGLPYDEELIERFISLPLVKDILTARKRMLDKAKLEKFSSPCGRVRSKKPTSKLALQAQAYELLLIHEIYKLAETTNKYEIMLYQFDGVTIDFRDERSKEYWQDRIRGAVEAKAADFGFHTTLEFDDLGGLPKNLTQVPKPIPAGTRIERHINVSSSPINEDISPSVSTRRRESGGEGQGGRGEQGESIPSYLVGR